MAMSAFGVEDNRISKAAHRQNGRHEGPGRAGGTFSRPSGTHAAGRRFVGEVSTGSAAVPLYRASAAQTQRSMGAGPTRSAGYEGASVMRSPSASQRRQASVGAAGQKVRAGYDYVRGGQAREDAVQNVESRVSAGRELAGARADRAKTVAGQVGGDIKNAVTGGSGYSRRGQVLSTAGAAGRRGINAVKLHPVRSGAIGAGITGAGAGIAYGVHRHNRSKLDQ